MHNRKIPRGLTETHEAEFYTWAGYKRINWIREVDNENDEIFSQWMMAIPSFIHVCAYLVILDVCSEEIFSSGGVGNRWRCFSRRPSDRSTVNICFLSHLIQARRPFGRMFRNHVRVLSMPSCTTIKSYSAFMTPVSHVLFSHLRNNGTDLTDTLVYGIVLERNILLKTTSKVYHVYKGSLVTRKPVFGVFEQVRLKPACSATEIS